MSGVFRAPLAAELVFVCGGRGGLGELEVAFHGLQRASALALCNAIVYKSQLLLLEPLLGLCKGSQLSPYLPLLC